MIFAVSQFFFFIDVITPFARHRPPSPRTRRPLADARGRVTLALSDGAAQIEVVSAAQLCNGRPLRNHGFRTMTGQSVAERKVKDLPSLTSARARA